MLIRTMIAAILIVTVANSAGAATLDTPVLSTVNLNDHVTCNILNVGTKVIEASIDLRDSITGNSVSQSLVTVASGTSQRITTTVISAGGVVTFYCHFDFKGSKRKVRANIAIGDSLQDLATAEAQ